MDIRAALCWYREACEAHGFEPLPLTVDDVRQWLDHDDVDPEVTFGCSELRLERELGTIVYLHGLLESYEEECYIARWISSELHYELGLYGCGCEFDQGRQCPCCHDGGMLGYENGVDMEFLAQCLRESLSGTSDVIEEDGVVIDYDALADYAWEIVPDLLEIAESYRERFAEVFARGDHYYGIADAAVAIATAILVNGHDPDVEFVVYNCLHAYS